MAMNNQVDPSMWVTLTVDGITERFYQPAEGGWRAYGAGPLRVNRHGLARTYPSLEQAAQAIRDHQGTSS